MTNAERQAEYQRRKKKRLAQCVTPDDVLKAARLIYEADAADNPEEERPPFDEWVKGLTGKRRGLWRQWVPDEADPWHFEDFAPDDAALLMRVAAVARAVKCPPASAD